MSAEMEQDIFNTPVDNAQAKQEADKLCLTPGWYVTETTTFRAETKDDGRRVASYFADVINAKNPEERGKIGFRFSPDLRQSEKDPEKADWNYRMFLQARKAFIDGTGAEPATANDVVRYLAEYPIKLRIVRTEDSENMVVAIAAVRE